VAQKQLKIQRTMNSETLENQAAIYELIVLLRAKDNWCGETHVQKTAFFVEELGNHNLGYEFILYKTRALFLRFKRRFGWYGSSSIYDQEIVNPNYGPRLKRNPEVEQMLKEQFAIRRKA